MCHVILHQRSAPGDWNWHSAGRGCRNSVTDCRRGLLQEVRTHWLANYLMIDSCPSLTCKIKASFPCWWCSLVFTGSTEVTRLLIETISPWRVNSIFHQCKHYHRTLTIGEPVGLTQSIPSRALRVQYPLNPVLQNPCYPPVLGLGLLTQPKLMSRTFWLNSEMKWIETCSLLLRMVWRHSSWKAEHLTNRICFKRQVIARVDAKLSCCHSWVKMKITSMRFRNELSACFKLSAFTNCSLVAVTYKQTQHQGIPSFHYCVWVDFHFDCA